MVLSDDGVDGTSQHNSANIFYSWKSRLLISLSWSSAYFICLPWIRMARMKPTPDFPTAIILQAKINYCVKSGSTFQKLWPTILQNVYDECTYMFEDVCKKNWFLGKEKYLANSWVSGVLEVNLSCRGSIICQAITSSVPSSKDNKESWKLASGRGSFFLDS